jgi:hypothetical protein
LKLRWCLETLLACFASKLAHSAPGANLRTDSDQGGGEGQAEELGPINRGRKRRGLHENDASGNFGEQGHAGLAGKNCSNADAANDLPDPKALIMAPAAIQRARRRQIEHAERLDIQPRIIKGTSRSAKRKQIGSDRFRMLLHLSEDP